MQNQRIAWQSLIFLLVAPTFAWCEQPIISQYPLSDPNASKLDTELYGRWTVLWEGIAIGDVIVEPTPLPHAPGAMKLTSIPGPRNSGESAYFFCTELNGDKFINGYGPKPLTLD